MTTKHYRAFFSDYQQGPLNATHLFTLPVAPKHDAGLGVEDQHKSKEITARITKGDNIRVLFVGVRVIDKAKLLNQFCYQSKQPVCFIECASFTDYYIGETEKQLSRLIADATTDNWILFFDEADALFGKCTDVMNSQDKYAKVDEHYLLQRIGLHPGLSILSVTDPHKVKALLPRLDYTLLCS